MGSLGYVLGGAAAGLGQGLHDVGTMQLKQIQEEGLMKLKEQYDTQRQQAGFEHEDILKGREIEAASTLKRAEMEQTAQLAKEKEESEERRTRMHGEYQVNAAYVGGLMRGGRSSSSKTAGTWHETKLNTTPVDEQGKPIPFALPAGTVLFSNGRETWARTERGMVRTDRNGVPVMPQSARNRVDPTEEELYHVRTNPNAVIPDTIEVPKAFKGGGTVRPANAGMTYSQAFEREHGYLPQEAWDAMTKSNAATARSQSGRDEAVGTMPYGGATVYRPSDFEPAAGPEPAGATSEKDSDNAQ
jgi:hypothetical protein